MHRTPVDGVEVTTALVKAVTGWCLVERNSTSAEFAMAKMVVTAVLATTRRTAHQTVRKQTLAKYVVAMGSAACRAPKVGARAMMTVGYAMGTEKAASRPTVFKSLLTRTLQQQLELTAMFVAKLRNLSKPHF